MMFWLAAIDVVVVSFFRNSILMSFKREVDMRLDLYNKGFLKKLPEDICISSSQIKKKECMLYRIKDGKYVYVNIGRIKTQLEKFTWTLILWEMALTMTIVMIVFAVFRRFSMKQKYTEDLLKFILLSVSHKLGNFISAQRVNLEFLDPDEPIVKKMKLAMDEMESDFNFLTETLGNISKNRDKEWVNLKKEVLGVIESLSKKQCDFELNLEDVGVRVDVNDLRIVLGEIFNNAVKYSNCKIKVSLKKKSGGVALAVSNRIADKPSNSGLGISIIEYISKKNNWVFSKKVKDSEFMVFLWIKR